ncbi:MAG: hypothetical protein PHQ32_00235 [Firmicutes bacterium]|nr:hypothetical protein [Bacillota bacterium]
MNRKYEIYGIFIGLLLGLFSLVNFPANVVAEDYFSKDEVVCQEIVDLGFTPRVYIQGNTARIEYKSNYGSEDSTGPRESVLGGGSIITGKTIRVDLTFIPEGAQRESIKESWSNLNLSEMYKQYSDEILEGNISSDSIKYIFLSEDKGSYSKYRFRRDVVIGDFEGVISISSASLDSRVIPISVNELLNILEDYGFSLLNKKVINIDNSNTSDNIAEATEKLDLIVGYLQWRMSEGDSDEDIARLVNKIVAERVQATNNLRRSPLATIYNFVFGSYENSYGKWRNTACFNYDTNAIWTWHNRVGQCEEFAQLSYYLLSRAGITCNMYATDQHAFVIINEDRAKIDDSRDFGDNTFVVDPWQNKVINGKDAYKNGYLLDNGKSPFMITTNLYQPPKGYEDITTRNIVWDKEKKTWVSKKGYVFKYDMAQAWVGYAIKK